MAKGGFPQGAWFVPRKKSHIPALLAANIRPVRRPPGRTAPGSPPVRLASADEPPPNKLPAVSAERSPQFEDDDLARLVTGLRLAGRAVGLIHRLLLDLEKLLEPEHPQRRRSPREIAALQDALDAILDRIDRAANEARCEGRLLLDGNWCVPLPGPRHADRPSLRIQCLKTDRLGRAGLGMLSAARSGGPADLRRGRLGLVRSITAAAIELVAGQRDEIAAFSSLLAELPPAPAVAAENHAAAAAAHDDADFAAATSRLNRLDALLHSRSEATPTRRQAPSLRISRP